MIHSRELVFDTRGNDKQKQCAIAWCDDSITEITYGGSKGGAKSFTGVNLIFGDAFIYPETHYFIARKKLNDLRKFTVPSIMEVFGIWGITQDMYKLNHQDNYYVLHNGSKVYLIEAKYLPSDPMYYRFGSMQMTRGWIEEAGEFESAAKEALQASIGRWKNKEYKLVPKLLQTCNPSKNYLYKDVYKPHKAGKLPKHMTFIQALPKDNKMLAPGYLEHLNKTLSQNAKERLLFGNWEYDDDPDALVDYEAILDIFTNTHVPHGKKYITADIARMGSDKAVILVWSGWKIIQVETIDKGRTTEIQNIVTALRRLHQIPASCCIADEDGVGGGVVDNLDILGFINNSRPMEGEADLENGGMKKENYYNLQSQCCFKLAEMIQNGQLHVACDLSATHKEEIVEELEQLKSYDNDGIKPLRILPKEIVKDHIGRSPDWRDAMMMRVYFDYGVKKKIKYTVK